MTTVMLAALAAWCLLTLAVVTDRVLHDLRQRPVRRAGHALEPPRMRSLPREERLRAVERLLSGVSRATAYRVASDGAVSPLLAEAVAGFAAARWGTARLRRDAMARGRRARWRRIAALRILAALRHRELVPLLKSALRSGDPAVAGVAVALLGRQPERRAAELLVAALRDGTHPGSRVATALDAFPQATADLLLPLLTAERASARMWAATLLARCPGHPGLDAALAALTCDGDASVRRAAVESLGRIGGSRAADAALRRLEDPAWFVKAHAARAIGELGRVDLAPRLLPLLADEQWWVRLAARQALEALGPAVWSDVASCLDGHDRFARDGAAEVLQSLGLGAAGPGPEKAGSPGADPLVAPIAALEEVCS